MGSATPHTMGIDRYDDISLKNLKELIKKSNEKRADYYQQLKNDKEEFIFNIIKFYSKKGGILHKEIAEIMEMDRKSIRPYVNRLKQKGLIKKNDIGKYIFINNFYDNPIFNAEVYAQSFILLLNHSYRLENQKFVILNDDNKEFFDVDTGETQKVNFTTYKNIYSFKPCFTEKDKLQKSLFEFSNQIGSFIIYLLIYAMNPENYNVKLSSKDYKNIVRRIVNNGINNIIPFLIEKFFSVFHYDNNNITISNNNWNSEEQNILLQEDNLKELIKVFNDLYPLITFEFEKTLDKRYIYKNILKHIPPQIEYYQEKLIHANKILQNKNNKDPNTT